MRLAPPQIDIAERRRPRDPFLALSRRVLSDGRSGAAQPRASMPSASAMNNALGRCQDWVTSKARFTAKTSRARASVSKVLKPA
ncbi:hypothetical protein A8U91_01835 [Halomonas elongata]|uniref:Uncharacterized protein n=1 Tax=Halomonas elongata TaxID=2746 RepID=A0A1B8P5F1_HALEL|nr:hypothetical protein A8U91_01835 [Halomonas elongata]